MKAELNNLVQKQVFSSETIQDTTVNSIKTKRKTTNNGESTTNKPKTMNSKTSLPETKQVDGKTWHWCAHCAFWHLSHGTARQKIPPHCPLKPSTKTTA